LAVLRTTGAAGEILSEVEGAGSRRCVPAHAATKHFNVAANAAILSGGLLIMMGHHARSEALFYYFRLEDQVPENHLLRLIGKHISFEFVREQVKDSYSETGRPSVDPELLLRYRAAASNPCAKQGCPGARSPRS